MSELILGAHQPAYLPWLGFFHKIALSDTFCIVDTVDYSRYSFVNRNLIKTANGVGYLTVPIEARGSKRICDLRIAGERWSRKHRSSILQAYAKAPYVRDYAPEIEAVLEKRYVYLTELNSDLLRLLLRMLGIKVNLVIASDYRFAGRKSEYVLDLCRSLNATAFVFGAGGRSYARVNSFCQAGIQTYFQDYRHPVYRQCHGSFISRLSILDLLFNEGPRSLEVIFRGNVRSLPGGFGGCHPEQNHPLATHLGIEHQ